MQSKIEYDKQWNSVKKLFKKSMFQVYFVVEGGVMVNISGNVKNVKVNDCFMVIQGKITNKYLFYIHLL